MARSSCLCPKQPKLPIKENKVQQMNGVALQERTSGNTSSSRYFATWSPAQVLQACRWPVGPPALEGVGLFCKGSQGKPIWESHRGVSIGNPFEGIFERKPHANQPANRCEPVFRLPCPGCRRAPARLCDSPARVSHVLAVGNIHQTAHVSFQMLALFLKEIR